MSVHVPTADPRPARRSANPGMSTTVEVGESRRPAVPDARGPRRLSPSAGAVLVGARSPLAAYNIVLDTKSLAVAQEIAAAVRESGGGMVGVQALGLRLEGSERVQVSMNLIDLEQAALHLVVARVAAEARRREVEVVEGELVGLLPAAVVVAAAKAAGVDDAVGASTLPTAEALAAAATAFALPELAPDRVIEYHLALT